MYHTIMDGGANAKQEDKKMERQYPYDICPETLTKKAAQRGFSYELRGDAFLSVIEAEWLEARHRFLDTLDR